MFRDLISDDLSVVLNILSILGICVDPETQHKLEQYVIGHKRHSKGRVKYNGGVFGLKRQSIQDRFRSYHEAFQLVDSTTSKEAQPSRKLTWT